MQEPGENGKSGKKMWGGRGVVGRTRTKMSAQQQGSRVEGGCRHTEKKKQKFQQIPSIVPPFLTFVLNQSILLGDEKFWDEQKKQGGA
ncbi:hypothetical protein O9992_00875 [Vibrio lentus]|nr:hypothetical protein [Vibrio lentus]